ncbi:MAG: HAD family phosphatase [archaeon]
MAKAVIFDMDGVLIDSTKYIWKSFNQLLSKYNVQIPDDKVKKYLGRSLRDKIELWKKDYNIKEKIDPQEFSKSAFVLELKLMKKEVKPNQHLQNLIKKLKQNKIKVAVATSNYIPRASHILELIQVKDKMDTITTLEEIQHHKPHPEIFLKTAEKLEVKPEECIVIEDAVNGIEAAKKANMKAIALLTKFHTREEFEKADLIINSLSELTFEKIQALTL